GQWMRRIPGTTFEGAPLKTGLVLDTTSKAPPRHDPGTALFKTPLPIAEVFGSKQDLVLADGRSSFLLVRTDMKVHGVVITKAPIDIEYMRHGVTPSLDDLPDVERLWIQSIDHHRLSIYGTLSNGSLIHVADIQNGALRLRDPKADFEAAVSAVEEVVDEEVRGRVRDFMHALLARTMAGRGGVAVIGQKPRRIDVRRRLDPGIHLDRVEGDWQSFLNPDGVALVSSALELTAVGCFIKTITTSRSGGSGTRHAAAAKATEGRKNVALAMSDDKTLSVYKNGVRITRLG
ncbi:MAG: DNA integrity scanning protein DisA nucleotide-binding domain protein, partial [Polyangiaceae bacterium]|nr:DNA integrity scanning protein DisA nucleotide-binding domain protein [Polyangiaceae bacterium]